MGHQGLTDDNYLLELANLNETSTKKKLVAEMRRSINLVARVNIPG